MQILPPRPVAWRLLLIPAALHFLLHILTNGNFGVFRDEYYYLACAARPAWGYVDQPPFSVWLLAAWKAMFGDSAQSIRVLPALCGSGLIVLAGATAAQLGGGRWAQVMGGLCVAFGMTVLVVTGFYSMNAFDFLFWLGAYFLLIRIARSGDGRGWIGFGLVVGLGLFNKIGLVVFGASLVVGLLATEHRRFFRDRCLYLGGAIAFLFLLPYAVWNLANENAALEFIENAKSGKIASFTPWEYMSECMLEANPLTLPIWVGGLLWLLLAPSARRFRLVGLMFVATFVILNLQRSKPYYFATSFPVMMAAGAVAWETWTHGRRWIWVRWVLMINLIVGGALLLPLVVPLLSPEKTLAHFERLGIQPTPAEVGHTSPLPQYYSDRFGWENLARVVSEVYTELPAHERERCGVFGQNYGHAGAMEYWAKDYPLPPAFSTHNNYWIWGPPPDELDVWIVIRGNPDALRVLFEEVTEAAVATDPHALESPMRIWRCRGLRRPLSEIWDEDKSYG